MFLTNVKHLLENVVNAIPPEFVDEKVKKEAEARLKLLVEEFRVPEEEAVRTVIKYIAKEKGVPDGAVAFVQAPVIKVSSLRPREWASLKVKLVKLWDSKSEVVVHSGLVGDETGVVKFVIWSDSPELELKEGGNYLFENVFVQEYNGKLEVSVTRRSRIREIDEEVGLPERELAGAIVAIHKGSGLIQRCPECRGVIKGVCPTHGKVDAVDDLRAKVVVDDGVSVYSVVMGEEVVKALTGIGLKEAREIAAKALDRDAVRSELIRRLFGRYIRIRISVRGGGKGKGDGKGRYYVADEAEFA